MTKDEYLTHNKTYYMEFKLFELVKRIEGTSTPIFVQFMYCPESEINRLCFFASQNYVSGGDHSKQQFYYNEIKREEMDQYLYKDFNKEES